jgi:hypothetical protein
MSTHPNREETQARKRILLALFVSLLVHLLALLKFGSFSHSADRLESAPLNVRLVGPVNPLPDLGRAVVAKEQVSIKTEVSDDAAKPMQPASELRSTERPAEIRKVVQPTTSAAQGSSRVGGSMPSAPLEQSKQSNQSPGMPFPGVTSHVVRAEIEFQLLSGEEKDVVGVVRHAFSTNSTQTGEFYTLNVAKVSTNSAEDLADEWQLAVSGRANEKGLTARSYELKGASAARLFSLREVGGAKEQLAGARRGSTPDGILDRQSLLYHFSRQPPSFNGGGLWLADSITHGYYRYRVVGFEQQPIATQGTVRTLRLHLSETETGEVIELWLAPDMSYLPMRVRHVDRKGVVTEQIATSLSYN